MPSLSKDFWIAILFIIGMAGSAATGWFARGERIQNQVVKIQVKQQKAVDAVNERKAAREIVYRDRIQVIHDTQDNCLDQSLPPDILRAISASPTESRTDEELRISGINWNYLSGRD